MQTLFLNDWILVLFFSLWVVLTLVKNSPTSFVPRFVRGIVNENWFSSWIPSWSFFAPNPGVYSYYLLIRDKNKEDAVGEWHEVHIAKRSKWICAIWNSTKKVNKTLMDFANEFARLVQNTPEDKRDHLQLSTAYLAILSTTSFLPRAEDSFARQFLILRGTPGNFQVYYMSKFHRL